MLILRKEAEVGLAALIPVAIWKSTRRGPQGHVAPTGSRLYRRLAIGEWSKNAKRAASPRYSRLPVGATGATFALVSSPCAWF